MPPDNDLFNFGGMFTEPPELGPEPVTPVFEPGQASGRGEPGAECYVCGVEFNHWPGKSGGLDGSVTFRDFLTVCKWCLPLTRAVIR